MLQSIVPRDNFFTTDKVVPRREGALSLLVHLKSRFEVLTSGNESIGVQVKSKSRQAL